MLIEEPNWLLEHYWLVTSFGPLLVVCRVQILGLSRGGSVASGRDTNLGVASSHSAHSEENGTKVAQKCRGRCK